MPRAACPHQHIPKHRIQESILSGEKLAKVVELMARLRGPAGCPWDRAQDYDSVKGLLLEEAYEVIDAVAARDFHALEEELGDLLFQVVFYSRLTEEENRFTIDEVVDRLHAKLVRRHPHVFGTKRACTPEEALASWNEVKEREREGQAKGAVDDTRARASLLDGISTSLPSTLQAYELGVRAAEAGFDWARVEDLLEKIEEEMDELRQELKRPDAPPGPGGGPASGLSVSGRIGLSRIEEEVGDLLFAAANLARFVHSDPESCLRRANQKFERRFRRLELELAQRGKKVGECSPEELDEAWTRAKRQGREY